MQHTGPEEGLRKGWNVDEECADVQLNMWDPSKNNQTLDTEEYHTGTEAVWFGNRLAKTLLFPSLNVVMFERLCVSYVEATV